MREKLGTVLVLGIVTCGCAQPTVDTSTEESLESSLERVRDSVPEEQRDEFDTALQELAFADISLESLMAQGAADDVDILTPKLKDRIAGKSASEILDEAQAIREERERKEREQALQEIAELAAKEKAAESARQALAAFQVKRSRYKKGKDSLGLAEPVIELTVLNGTEHAISRASFRGTLASPGRAVPWLRDDFNYKIRGGLEPGEEATWRLAPNMFSEWGTVDAPTDAILTVEVIRLDGPDGETLYDAEGLSEFEKERLHELTAKYGIE